MLKQRWLDPAPTDPHLDQVSFLVWSTKQVHTALQIVKHGTPKTHSQIIFFGREDILARLCLPVCSSCVPLPTRQWTLCGASKFGPVSVVPCHVGVSETGLNMFEQA